MKIKNGSGPQVSMFASRFGVLGLLMLSLFSFHAAAQTKYEIVPDEEKRKTVTNFNNKKTSVDIEHVISFSLTRNRNVNKNQPSLKNNTISLSEGAFGIKLNSSVEEMMNVLGTPTSTLNLSENIVLFSYGRNLWIVTVNGLVHQVSSENQWVSSSLTNLIAFDDRFDNQWKIQDSVGYELSKAAIDAMKLNGQYVGNNIYRFTGPNGEQLDALLTVRSINGDRALVVTGFNYTLAQSNVNSMLSLTAVTESKEVIEYIEDRRAQGETIALDELTFSPSFEAFSEDGAIIHVYENNLVLQFQYDELNKLSVYEGLFDFEEKKQKWQYAKHYSGQSGDEVIQMYGDEVMGLDNYWQVFLDDAKYDFYFDETESGLALVEFEMEFF